MGQAMTPNAQSLQNSLRLFELQMNQHALKTITPFLICKLSQEDKESFKKEARKFSPERFTIFNRYLEWLYLETSKKQVEISHICQILILAIEIYAEKQNLENKRLEIEPTFQSCLYQVHFKNGLSYFAKAQYEKAIQSYEMIAKYYPNDGNVYLHIGEAYQKLNKYEECKLSYLRALQYNIEYQRCVINLALLYETFNEKQNQQICLKRLIKMNPQEPQYQQLLGKYLNKCKRWDQSIKIFTKLIKRSPKSEYIDQLHIAASASTHYLENLGLYRQIISIYPSNDQLIYNLGLLYSVLLMEEEMFQCFQKCLRLNKNHKAARQTIANHFSSQENYLAEALQSYEELAVIDSNNAQIYLKMGNIEFQQGEIAKSITYYRKAISLNPNRFGLYLYLASSNIKLAKYNEAIFNLQIALNLNPNDSQIYNLLGNAYIGLQDSVSAIQNYKKAIKANPKAEAPYFNLGLISYYDCKYEKALKYLTYCIELNPLHSLAFCLVSQIYMRTNEQIKAIQFLQSVIKKNPINSSSYCELGNAYYLIYNYEEALKNYKIAYSLNENDKYSIYQIGVMLLFLGRYQQSLLWITKAKQMQRQNKYFQCGYGICLTKLKRYSEAIDIFQHNINRNPDYYEPYFHLGRALKLGGRQNQQFAQYQLFFKETEDLTSLYECKLFFYRGLEDFSQFFNNLNQILNLLRANLIDNMKQGKQKIYKFLHKFIESLNCIIRDGQYYDLVILLGIIYRDIGDKHRAKRCFNRIVSNNKFSHQIEPHEQLLFFYHNQLPTKLSQSDYCNFLIEFMIQQQLEIDQLQGLKAFKTFIQIEQIKDDYNIISLLLRIRTNTIQKLKSMVMNNINYFSINKSGKQFTKKQINFNQYTRSLVQNINSEGFYEQINDRLKSIIFYSNENEVIIKQSSFPEMEQEINIHYKVSMQNIYSILSTNETVGQKKEKIYNIVRYYLDFKFLYDILLLIYDELIQIVSVQEEIVKKFQIFISQMFKKETRLSQIFDNIYTFLKSNSVYQENNFESVLLFDRNNYLINLQSNIIYQDYQYQTSNNHLENRLTFQNNIVLRLSRDFLQTKNHNKEKMVQEYKIQNEFKSIFQRILIKPKKIRSTINLQVKEEIPLSQIQKAYRSQIFEDDEQQFD